MLGHLRAAAPKGARVSLGEKLFLAEKLKKKSYAFILKRLQSLMGLVKDIINYPNSRKDNANATNTASYQVL